MKFKSLLFAALALASMSAMADVSATDYFTIDDINAKVGETVTVPVKLVNPTADYAAVQFFVKPATANDSKGIKAVLDAGKPWLNPTGRSNAGEKVTWAGNVVAGEIIRAVGVQMNNKTSLTKSDKGDAVVEFKIEILKEGTYNYVITDGHASNANGVDPDFQKKTFKVTATASAVKDVTTAKEVAGVKYYNIAGVESAQPFDGINVVVTTYTDGSKTTTKVVK